MLKRILHLICVVKAVIHEACNQRCLSNCNKPNPTFVHNHKTIYYAKMHVTDEKPNIMRSAACMYFHHIAMCTSLKVQL